MYDQTTADLSQTRSQIGNPQNLFPEGIPNHEILEELGAGGMGIVYKAKQISLGRIVALKMMRHSTKNPTELERFQCEAEVIASFSHPNIVQVYDIGEHKGQPFFTLEYCPNGNLDKQLLSKPMKNEDAARLVETLALAIDVAHQAGIIHRDLKPANVLIGSSGEPKITDFGIAKMLDEDSGATGTGVIMGTPSYMAPEQAQGKSREAGPATDVYALGAILYQCLTGRPPFLAATPMETMRQVLEDNPVPPKLLNRGVDHDLERICLKCLEKSPEDRYQTSKELAADLRRYLDGEPIQAKSINVFERLQRELKRSQHEGKIGPWGKGLLYLGIFIILMHLATSLLLHFEYPEWLSFWIPRTFMILCLIPWLRRYRPNEGLLPTNALERQIWSVWVAYLVSFTMLLLVVIIEGRDHLHIYGAGMIISGLAWFSMGGLVWGGAYLIGIGFWVLAPFIALMSGSNASPAAFGLIWGLALIITGLRYQKLLKNPPTN